MASRTLRRLEYVLVALAFHLVFTWSIFDVYFRSPVVYPDARFSASGVAHAPLPAPAERLVLIVGDGLRADTLFQAHPAERFPAWAQHSIAARAPFAPFARTAAPAAPPLSLIHI